MKEKVASGPIDLPFLMLTLMLLGIGLVMVFSASYASAFYDKSITSPLYYIWKQGLYAVAGLAAMAVIIRFDYQAFRALSIPGIVISIVLLVLVKFSPLGVSINGTRRWINIGFQFQPSELAKIAIIVFFAAKMSQRDARKPRKWSKRSLSGNILNSFEKIGLIELIPYILILGAVAGLVVIQTHLSGTILILVGGASVLLAGGIGIWWFIIGGGVVLPLGLWIVAKIGYMQERIDIWRNPFDPNLDSFQIRQSLISIGSGGLLGRGLGQSIQKYNYVPEPENDFIFPIVVEELGFVGAMIIILLFVLLIMRGYWLAIKARDRFGTLVIVGIITLLAVQVFLNIAVVTNLIPTTGISLPFFSFGGTALIIQLAEMGIILCISRQIPAETQD